MRLNVRNSRWLERRFVLANGLLLLVAVNLACAPPAASTAATPQESGPEFSANQQVAPTPTPASAQQPPPSQPVYDPTEIEPPKPIPTPRGATGTPTPIPAAAPMRAAAIANPAYSSPENIQKQAQYADVIVVGTIKEVGPPQWSTESGARPANPHAGIPGQGNNRIFRMVTLSVSSSLKGVDNRPTIPFTQSGGQIGDDVLEVKPSIDLASGKRVIAFLKNPEPGSFPSRLPQGTYYGLKLRYLVENGTVKDAFNSTWSMPLNDFASLVTGAD